jgi:hypothetical protein
MLVVDAFVLATMTGVWLAGTADLVAAELKYIALVVLVTADEVVKNETRTWSRGAPAAETGEQLIILGTADRTAGCSVSQANIASLISVTTILWFHVLVWDDTWLS